MVKEINSTKAYSILQQSGNTVLIDVRSSMEYEYVGHPINAIHIPIKEPPDWEIRTDFINNVRSELEKKFPDIQNLSEVHIILLCRSGKRSGQAAVMLESEGYKNIINIIDGFEGDKDANDHRSVINGWRFNKLPWEQG
tara:strand:- start:1350 stop:1766 length:417 start_codon:yes stop_codon:yes gene_type:complete